MEYISILFILTKLLLKLNLIKSTIGIKIPNCDTLFGPMRVCDKLSTFRSNSVNHPDLSKINNKHKARFTKGHKIIS